MAAHPSAPERSFEEMTLLLRQLEARLENVERRLGIDNAATIPAPALEIPPSAVLPANFGDTAGMTVLIGKSFLGLALAYLLRALTENGSLPAPAGVALGLAYALGWLIWAARTHAAETFAVSLRALTAVLIVVPLLWEAHLRFHAVSTWATAGVLVFLSAFGLGISWRKNLTAVAWISSLAGLLSCCALLIATRDLVPYTAAILALAAAVEASACLEHYLGERWIVAIAADLSIVLLTSIATRPPGEVFGYAPMARGEVLALQIALVLIYLASTILRTMGRGFQIAVFEIGQCVVAFLVSASGAIAVAGKHPAAIATVGVFCSLSGLACYLVSFAFRRQRPAEDRNFHTYATFGLVLILAGTWLLFHGAVLVAIWSSLAVLFVLAGLEAGRMTLKLHAGAYVVLATFASGSAAAANIRFLGLSPHAPAEGTPLAVWLVGAAALASYVLLLRGASPEGNSPPYRVASLLLAASAFWNLAEIGGAIASPLCRAAHGTEAADFCPTILTLILAGLSLAAARAASMRDRPELRWIAILFAAVATYKLVSQDLRQAHTFAAVLSLIIYGGALVLLPRILRRVPRQAPAAADVRA